MILGDTGFHSDSDLFAFLVSINTSHLSYMSLALEFTEKMIVWPVVSVFMPDVFHLTPLSPRISSWYLSISSATCWFLLL